MSSRPLRFQDHAFWLLSHRWHARVNHTTQWRVRDMMWRGTNNAGGEGEILAGTAATSKKWGFVFRDALGPLDCTTRFSMWHRGLARLQYV